MADLGDLAPIGHGLLGGVTTGMNLFGQLRRLALAEEEADRRREDAEALRRDRELRRTLAAVSAFNAVGQNPENLARVTPLLAKLGFEFPMEDVQRDVEGYRQAAGIVSRVLFEDQAPTAQDLQHPYLLKYLSGDKRQQWMAAWNDALKRHRVRAILRDPSTGWQDKQRGVAALGVTQDLFPVDRARETGEARGYGELVGKHRALTEPVDGNLAIAPPPGSAVAPTSGLDVGVPQHSAPGEGTHRPLPGRAPASGADRGARAPAAAQPLTAATPSGATTEPASPGRRLPGRVTTRGDEIRRLERGAPKEPADIAYAEGLMPGTPEYAQRVATLTRALADARRREIRGTFVGEDGQVYSYDDAGTARPITDTAGRPVRGRTAAADKALTAQDYVNAINELLQGAERPRDPRLSGYGVNDIPTLQALAARGRTGEPLTPIGEIAVSLPPKDITKEWAQQEFARLRALHPTPDKDPKRGKTDEQIYEAIRTKVLKAGGR